MTGSRYATLGLVVLLVLSGCSAFQGGTPTASPTATGTPAPSATPSPTVTPTPTPTATPLPDAATASYPDGFDRAGITNASVALSTFDRLLAEGRYRATANVTTDYGTTDYSTTTVTAASTRVRWPNGTLVQYETTFDDQYHRNGTIFEPRDPGTVAFVRTAGPRTRERGSVEGRRGLRRSGTGSVEMVRRVATYAVIADDANVTVVRRNGSTWFRYQISGVDPAAAVEAFGGREPASRYQWLTARNGMGRLDRTLAEALPDHLDGTVLVDDEGRFRRADLAVTRTRPSAGGNETVRANLSLRVEAVGEATGTAPRWTDEIPVLRATVVDDYDAPVVRVDHVDGPPVAPDGRPMEIRVHPLFNAGGTASPWASARVTNRTLGVGDVLYVHGTPGNRTAATVGERPDPDAVAPFQFGDSDGPPIAVELRVDGDPTAVYYLDTEEVVTVGSTE